MAELNVVTIDKFLGVNKSETETLLQLGEASEMSNFIITNDNKLQKQFGYKALNECVPNKKINGVWYGAINGTFHFLFARGGKVYELGLEYGEESDIGTITDAYPTTFWATNNTVYIMDGTEFYSWDGTVFQVVEGYIPTYATAVPPSGGGTLLEGLNYLTGKKQIKFSGDGASKIFQLPEIDIDSVDKVVVGTTEMEPGTDYTVDLANGQVTFVNAPPNAPNNVVITWTKEDEESREKITKCRYYGGQYFARFWIFGNPDHRNTRYCSGVTMAGTSDPTYWPMFTDSAVGEYMITDIKTQYDKQLIWTTGDSSGASAWYSTSELYTDPNTGLATALFPVYPLNVKVGNDAPGQVQIIMNNPFTIWKGVYEWVSTYVINEKNVQWISKRIQRDLDQADLTTAITWDWDDKGIYLLCVGKRIWCYNYRVDAWYILDLPHEPTCFTTANKQLYFGTTDGQIMRFDEELKTYDGEVIEAVWDMGFHNFGVDWIRKFIQRIFISLRPDAKSKVTLIYETDRTGESDEYKAEYNLLDWDEIDFDDFSFKINRNPQPFKFKIRAKKIDYFKIILRNDFENYNATILSITIPMRMGGEVKQRR